MTGQKKQTWGWGGGGSDLPQATGGQAGGPPYKGTTLVTQPKEGTASWAPHLQLCL